jgi:hypothetical protein
MWEPQPLATLRDSMACTGITLPLLVEVPVAAAVVVVVVVVVAVVIP